MKCFILIRKKKTNMIFSSVIVSFLVCLIQPIPSVLIPPGISRAFVILLVPAVGISPENLVNWRQERPRKELNATSDAQFAALPLDKPFARAVVNWRSRSVAKSAISHKTVSTQHGDAIPPNLIGSFSNNDLVSTILRRLNTVYVMTGLSFLK